jgi:hypothetical protein
VYTGAKDVSLGAFKTLLAKRIRRGNKAAEGRWGRVDKRLKETSRGTVVTYLGKPGACG